MPNRIGAAVNAIRSSQNAWYAAVAGFARPAVASGVVVVERLGVSSAVSDISPPRRLTQIECRSRGGPYQARSERREDSRGERRRAAALDELDQRVQVDLLLARKPRRELAVE